MTKRIGILLVLAFVLAIPFLLRREGELVAPDALPLVILSPHNKAIQYEYEQAFRKWHRARYGRDVDIDWRNLGGTSEIVRFIDGEYEARKDLPEAGIGVDLFFGGGQYDHGKQARKGHTVPCGLRDRHPEWLAEEVLPINISGEWLYDKGDRWYGCCLSSFGLCYNEDVLRDKAINIVPRQWEDLGHPELFREIALADPTKSGSITKAFEMLIQQQMALEVAAAKLAPEEAGDAVLSAGWARAMRAIRMIAGNARYFTDSASKVPIDVSHGNAAAGMCIDFYGRFQSETVERNENTTRMKYVTPIGGSSVSADPISMLRGAPHAELARQFIDFCLSPDGQKLWNYRVGTPGGPERYALRRLPIRKDMYAPEHRRYMSDAQVYPFQTARAFTYQPQWTARLFGLIRVLIRTMCMDTHRELQTAWKAIIARGGPDACPEAMRILCELPPEAGYEQARTETVKRMRDKLEEVRLVRRWVLFFRQQYRAAAAAAGRES